MSTLPKDKDGKTPLHFAANAGVVNALIRKGAKVNDEDKNLITPLHWAAKDGVTEVVKALIAKNACVHAKDKSGRTPLHFAAMRDHMNVVRALLAVEGIDVNAKDNDGFTYLDYVNKKRDNAPIAAGASEGADTPSQSADAKADIETKSKEVEEAEVDSKGDEGTLSHSVDGEDDSVAEVHSENNEGTLSQSADRKDYSGAAVDSGDEDTPSQNGAGTEVSIESEKEAEVDSEDDEDTLSHCSTREDDSVAEVDSEDDEDTLSHSAASENNAGAAVDSEENSKRRIHTSFKPITIGIAVFCVTIAVCIKVLGLFITQGFPVEPFPMTMALFVIAAIAVTTSIVAYQAFKFDEPSTQVDETLTSKQGNLTAPSGQAPEKLISFFKC